MILGYNLYQIWSSDSIFVRCVFVDVWLIQGPLRLDLGWTVGSFFKGPWAWSLKVDLSGSSRSRWGLILRMNVSSRAVWGLILNNGDERIFKGFWAWSWRTKMNGSSRAFGLYLEERLDVWICWRCWSKGPSGLDLGMNEWWTMDTFFKGRRGLILNWWMIVDPKGRWGLILDERWTKNEESFLDSSGNWMLESFGVSELQSFKV